MRGRTRNRNGQNNGTQVRKEVGTANVSDLRAKSNWQSLIVSFIPSKSLE